MKKSKTSGNQPPVNHRNFPLFLSLLFVGFARCSAPALGNMRILFVAYADDVPGFPGSERPSLCGSKNEYSYFHIFSSIFDHLSLRGGVFIWLQHIFIYIQFTQGYSPYNGSACTIQSKPGSKDHKSINSIFPDGLLSNLE